MHQEMWRLMPDISGHIIGYYITGVIIIEETDAQIL